MQRLKFCPKCGRETLQWDGEKKWSCAACDYVLYHNLAAAVAVLITCGDEILFTRRNQEPKKGKLDLAGGFCDPGETAEETCVRELFEEMKFKPEVSQLRYLGSFPNVYEYKNIAYNTMDLFFGCEVAHKFSAELEASEISEAVWVRKDAIDFEELAFESQQRFLKEYLFQ